MLSCLYVTFSLNDFSLSQAGLTFSFVASSLLVLKMAPRIVTWFLIFSRKYSGSISCSFPSLSICVFSLFSWALLASAWVLYTFSISFNSLWFLILMVVSSAYVCSFIVLFFFCFVSLYFFIVVDHVYQGNCWYYIQEPRFRVDKSYMHTPNIKQEYLLQFLLLNIDSDVHWEIFVTSPWTTSVPKQMSEVTYQEKNGNVAGTLTWPNLLYTI